MSDQPSTQDKLIQQFKDLLNEIKLDPDNPKDLDTFINIFNDDPIARRLLRYGGQKDYLDDLPKVDIGVACYSMQPTQFWLPLLSRIAAEHRVRVNIRSFVASSSMLPDSNKNDLVHLPRRGSLTDINRMQVAESFLESDSEYLFFVDDDVVFPMGTIGHLINLKREFVNGLYVLPKHPYTPVAYMLLPNGLYDTLFDFPKGALLQVDAVGLGCAMIHKSVFKKIEDTHKMFMRPNGSLGTIPKSQVHDDKPFSGKNYKPFISKGALHMPLMPIPKEDERKFPFFQLEYCRTEDMHFSELCRNAGIPIWIDTNITCEHWKMKATTIKDYEEHIEENRLSRLETK